MINFFQAIFNKNNEFFWITNSAKRLTHVGFSSLLLPTVFVLIPAIIIQFGMIPFIFDNFQGNSLYYLNIFTLCVYFPMIVLMIFLWARFYEGRTFKTLGFTKTNFAKKYFNGFVLGFGMTTSVVGIMALSGNIEFSPDTELLTGFNALGFVSLFLLGFLLQGASEEILTRGWMFQVIGSRYSPWLGAVISSLFFSLMHLANSGINIPALINLVLLAVLMILLVLKDGSLWGACAWHSSWNWTLGNFYGLSVSGTGENPSVINLNTTGSDLFSGGGFGPEGSIITSVILMIGIVYFILIILNSRKEVISES